MKFQAKRNAILIVDDDEGFCESLRRSLKGEFEILIANNKDQARRQLWNAEVVLLDIILDRDDMENRDGMILLSEFLEERPELPIVMITGYGNVQIAVEAMKLGAIDFLEKPLDIPKLKASIDNALRQFRLSRKVKSLERELYNLEPIKLIGENETLKEIRRLIDYIANDGYITVLVYGETGTGKELVARLIHQRGWRSEGPFVPLSLAALAPSILESELFGYEKGAFTDAKERKIGYIEQANKGVLFLDDIDAASPDIQVKLLRFLEERNIYRLGSTKPVKVDVQVVTATNQNLFQSVKEKRFREDLFYRLNSIEIKMPPLREHPEDIPLICEHFLNIFRKQGRTNIKKITNEAIEVLKKYNWPGNVRELRNIIERACLLASLKNHDCIEVNDLPKEILMEGKFSPHETNKDFENFDLGKEKARFELSCIEQALEKAERRKGEAYKILGLNDRFALRRRIRLIEKRFPELIKEFPLCSDFLIKKRLN